MQSEMQDGGFGDGMLGLLDGDLLDNLKEYVA